MVMNLPLIDGQLFLDNSALEYLQTCARSAQYHVINRRVGAGSSAALNFGGAIHAALEHRYKLHGPTVGPNCKAEMHGILTEWFKEKPAPLEDYRCLSLATQVVDGYLDKYKSEEWDVARINGLPAVEVPFALPLFTTEIMDPNDLTGRPDLITTMFCGKIDLVVLEGRDYWIVDHKTSSMGASMGQDEQKMSFQWKGYCWAVQQSTGVVPYGAMINHIQARKPNTTEAGLARRKPIEPKDFQRMRFILEEHHIGEWKENVIACIKRFLRDYEDGFFPMLPKQHCVGKYGKCPFYEVCEMPPSLRPQALLDFTKPDEFSPLNAIKTTYANNQAASPTL